MKYANAVELWCKFEAAGSQSGMFPFKCDADVLRITGRLVMEGRERLIIYVKHATNTPIYMDESVNEVHEDTIVDNAKREVDDINVREGVDVYKEADNIDMELDDEQESVDWEAAANVEDADIVVEGGDREEADNVVEGGDGEEADNVDEGGNGEVDVSDFPETDDIVLELYPKAYFVDPEVEAETRKIAID